MAGPIRFCPLCKQADDHPRHVIAAGGDANVAPHMDCCRDAGCPDGSCPIVLANVPKGAQGDKLQRALSNMDMDKVNEALDARDDATRNFTANDVTTLNGASA